MRTQNNFYKSKNLLDNGKMDEGNMQNMQNLQNSTDLKGSIPVGPPVVLGSINGVAP